MSSSSPSAAAAVSGNAALGSFSLRACPGFGFFFFFLRGAFTATAAAAAAASGAAARPFPRLLCLFGAAALPACRPLPPAALALPHGSLRVAPVFPGPDCRQPEVIRADKFEGSPFTHNPKRSGPSWREGRGGRAGSC